MYTKIKKYFYRFKDIQGGVLAEGEITYNDCVVTCRPIDWYCLQEEITQHMTVFEHENKILGQTHTQPETTWRLRIFPLEILFMIFSYLSPKELIKLYIIYPNLSIEYYLGSKKTLTLNCRMMQFPACRCVFQYHKFRCVCHYCTIMGQCQSNVCKSNKEIIFNMFKTIFQNPHTIITHLCITINCDLPVNFAELFQYIQLKNLMIEKPTDSSIINKILKYQGKYLKSLKINLAMNVFPCKHCPSTHQSEEILKLEDCLVLQILQLSFTFGNCLIKTKRCPMFPREDVNDDKLNTIDEILTRICKLPELNSLALIGDWRMQSNIFYIKHIYFFVRFIQSLYYTPDRKPLSLSIIAFGLWNCRMIYDLIDRCHFLTYFEFELGFPTKFLPLHLDDLNDPSPNILAYSCKRWHLDAVLNSELYNFTHHSDIKNTENKLRTNLVDIRSTQKTCDCIWDPLLTNICGACGFTNILCDNYPSSSPFL